MPEFDSFKSFVSYSELWPLFAYLLLGISGGIFIVPLYSLMQFRAKPNERAQVIAGLNIYNSLFMVGSAVLGIICLSVLEAFDSTTVCVARGGKHFSYALPVLSGAIYAFRFFTWVVTHTACTE